MVARLKFVLFLVSEMLFAACQVQSLQNPQNPKSDESEDMWRHASPLKLRSILSRSSSASAGFGNATVTGVTSSRQFHIFSIADKLTSSLPSRSSVLIREGSYVFRIPNSRFAVAVRCFSIIPQSTVDWNEPVSCSEVGDGANLSDSDSVDVDPDRPAIPVRAFFLSTSVDLKGLVDQNKQNFVPPSSRMTNYVVLKFGNLRTVPDESAPTFSGSECTFMVAFQYGSVVLFNAPETEVDGYLKIVQKHAYGLLPEMRKDEYEVREKPASSTWMQAGLDHIILQYLNVDGIRTIGSVLGQSIALDYYVRQVDGMVAEFTDINRAMEKTGTFTMKRKKLFQLVGKANSNLADVILKLGLFERSDIAWKDAKYAQIWEYLRDEFELTQRFASLDYKLKFVEHNIRFLQEILQNRRSDFLEWLIIILISVEILISLYEITNRTSGL